MKKKEEKSLTSIMSSMLSRESEKSLKGGYEESGNACSCSGGYESCSSTIMKVLQGRNANHYPASHN